MHELKICNGLIRTMQDDLDHIYLYLKGDELISTHFTVIRTFESLQKQNTPSKWTNKSFYTPRINSLDDFFRCFLHKYDHLREIVTSLKCEVPPVIPMQKLFDPLHFLTSILWQYSVEHSVPLYNLEIELHPFKIPPTKAATQDRVYITGLQIKGGRISDRTFLDEEYSREYQSKMSGFEVRIVKKERKQILQVTLDPNPNPSLTPNPFFRTTSLLSRFISTQIKLKTTISRRTT